MVRLRLRGSVATEVKTDDDTAGERAAQPPVYIHREQKNTWEPVTAGQDTKRRQNNRTARWARRRVAQAISVLPRCRACGRTIRSRMDVGVRVREGIAGFSGLSSCGSVWACPVCSVKVMARRALEIGTVVALAHAEGLSVGFLTLTMRHHKGQRLDTLWDALAKAWQVVTASKGWELNRAAYGVEGWVRVVEVTWGDNGWHVHVHALVIGHFDQTGLDELAASMWGRWSRSLVRSGLDAPLSKASDWQLVGGDLSGTALGEYLAKGVLGAGSIGAELTMTQGKVARSRYSTHQVWELLDLFAATGDLDYRGKWQTWERGSKGRRQIGWSKGLRDRFLLDPELADEVIAAEELGTDADTVVWITRAGWTALQRCPERIPLLLDVAEHQGQQGLSTWLDLLNVQHRKA